MVGRLVVDANHPSLTSLFRVRVAPAGRRLVVAKQFVFAPNYIGGSPAHYNRDGGSPANTLVCVRLQHVVGGTFSFRELVAQTNQFAWHYI